MNSSGSLLSEQSSDNNGGGGGNGPILTPLAPYRSTGGVDSPVGSLEDSEYSASGQLQERQRPSLFVIQVTAVASLGGIIFGYDLGVISGALPQLTTAFDLNHTQQELVVSILYLGGGIGAALGGSICDTCGRKRAILWTDICFLVGAAMLYTAPSLEMVVAGRIVVGFAIAVSGIADVSYLHEIAPTEWRGSIVSVNEASIALGFLLAFAVGGILSAEGNENGWRLMFGFSGLIALVQLVGMWSMPESPTWLKEQGRYEESEAALRRIQSNDALYQDTDNETSARRSGNAPSSYSARPSPDTSMEDVLASITPSGSSNTGICGRCAHYCCLLVNLVRGMHSFVTTTARRYRRQTYIGLFLSVTQQLCGQTNVLSYAPIIFAGVAGNGESSSSFVRGWATLSIGLVKFGVTVLVIWKVESLGRRFLLLTGMATIAVGLLLLIIAFGDTEVQRQGEEEVVDKGSSFHFAMPGVLLVVSGYSMSFGPLTWLLTSELFPTDIRGRALGASTVVTYLCAALVTYTFLSSQAFFGSTVVFGAYLTVTCLGFLFAYMAVPDTVGKSVEEIDNDLKLMLWWKGDCVDICESRSSGEVSPLRLQPIRETELT